MIVLAVQNKQKKKNQTNLYCSVYSTLFGIAIVILNLRDNYKKAKMGGKRRSRILLRFVITQMGFGLNSLICHLPAYI